MKRPILFSGPMVRAILAGHKTQTRRVVTLPEFNLDKDRPGVWYYRDRKSRWQCLSTGDLARKCPYGQPGDLLWVRETWAKSPNGIVYRANFDVADGFGASVIDLQSGETVPLIWKPSIHMPKDASRISLVVEKVRIERVRQITDEDIRAEGINAHFAVRKQDPLPTPRSAFAQLWDSINKNRGFGWDVNPWVWVIEFRTVEK